MLVNKGSKIKTRFLRGTVGKVIDGRDNEHHLKGFRDTYYYEVDVDSPITDKMHIVRLDEITEVRNG